MACCEVRAMTDFYFVRHAESAWNAENRLCGRTDMTLSETGRGQAERLAERLRALHPDAFYTSPLQRARETAEIIARAVGLTPTVDERLIEINYGAWEGKTFAEVMQQDAETYRAWDADPAAVSPPDGESGTQALARVTPFLDELAARHPSERARIMVVTHKTICRLVVCHVLGLPPSEYRRRLTMDNAAVNIFRQDEEGWRLALLNDTSHLALPDAGRASINGTF
jgi:broad specificity phosphatase PhoE